MTCVGYCVSSWYYYWLTIYRKAVKRWVPVWYFILWKLSWNIKAEGNRLTCRISAYFALILTFHLDLWLKKSCLFLEFWLNSVFREFLWAVQERYILYYLNLFSMELHYKQVKKYVRTLFSMKFCKQIKKYITNVTIMSPVIFCKQTKKWGKIISWMKLCKQIKK